MRWFVGATLGVLLALPALAAEAAEGDFKDGWTTWRKAECGVWAEYRLEGGGTRRLEVLGTSKRGGAQYRETTTVADKEPAVHEPIISCADLRLPGQAAEAKAAWSEGVVEAAGKALTCAIATVTATVVKGDAAIQVKSEYWYCPEVPCGGLVRVLVDGKATQTLASFGGPSAAAPSDAARLPRFFRTEGNFAVYKTQSGKDARYERWQVTALRSGGARYTVAACDAAGVAAEDALVWTREFRDAADFGTVEEQNVEVVVAASKFSCEKRRLKKSGEQHDAWITDGLVVKRTRLTV